MISFEKLRGRIEPYIQSGNLNFLLGSGASLPAISLASTVEAEVAELQEKGLHLEADQKALQFIQALEAEHTLALGGGEGAGTVTLNHYKRLLSAIDGILYARKNSLLPRQANIFTSNYDAFIEQAASQLPNVTLNDGFDRSATINNNFFYAPERYFDRTYRTSASFSRQSEIPTINLFKIHGSVSWTRHDSNIVLRGGLAEPLAPELFADQAKVTEALKERVVILPNLGKFPETLLDRTYYDLLRIYSNALDRENAVLFTFGFSFKDEHILDVTRRALRNPTAQLLAFAYSDDEQEYFGQAFEHNRNVLIVKSPDELSDFDKVNGFFETALPKEG